MHHVINTRVSFDWQVFEEGGGVGLGHDDNDNDGGDGCPLTFRHFLLQNQLTKIKMSVQTERSWKPHRKHSFFKFTNAFEVSFAALFVNTMSSSTQKATTEKQLSFTDTNTPHSLQRRNASSFQTFTRNGCATTGCCKVSFPIEQQKLFLKGRKHANGCTGHWVFFRTIQKFLSRVPLALLISLKLADPFKTIRTSKWKPHPKRPVFLSSFLPLSPSISAKILHWKFRSCFRETTEYLGSFSSQGIDQIRGCAAIWAVKI